MVILNLFYTFSLVVSALIIPKYQKRYFFTKGIKLDLKLSKPISILVPAYNEEKTIVDSLRSFLSLDYERYEVVVSNDGSGDKTMEILKSAYELVEVDFTPNEICKSKPIKAVYFSRIEPKLVVVDKENGGKADAQNAAARVARFPYLLVVDADTLLDKEGLYNMAMRFTAEPDIAALGGIVRVANGCRIEDGIVKDVSMPRRFIERIQVLEYFRAFLFGRVSLAFMKSLMIISGAFGVFRWEAFAQLGGWNRQAIGEDMDAVMRLHRKIFEKGLSWKVDFVPDPVSWTQVPMTWKSLGNQRERWQRGLIQVVMSNKNMFLNPRYGNVGLIGFPYFVIFEMLSAVVEFLCYPLTIVTFVLGIVNMTYVIYFLCLVLVWGLCISFTTVLMQEDVKYRYSTTKDLKYLLGVAVFENFGFRQIHSFWRLWGLMKYIFVPSSRSSGMSAWKSIEREGYME
jgi:cellulose synthase/poly-beta-1,6-N-acetylglucosamine synthase-like glycosyltransferase